MSDIDPEVIATTDLLLDTAQKMIELGEKNCMNPEHDHDVASMVSSAMMIYTTIDSVGERKVDFVITQDLSPFEVIGMAQFLKELTVSDLIADNWSD